MNNKVEIDKGFDLENSLMGFFHQNQNGVFLDPNAIAKEILELIPIENHYEFAKGTKLYSYKAEEIVELKEGFPTIKSFTKGIELLNLTIGIEHKSNKSIRWIKLRCLPEYKKGMDGPIGLSGSFFEITDLLNFDITSKKQNKLLELIGQLSGQFINSNPQNYRQDIKNAIAQLGKSLNADRFYIFEYDFLNEVCSNTFEWCAEGVNPQIEILQNIPMQNFADWVEVHKKGEKLVINDVGKIEGNVPLKEILQEQQIKSLITVPLMEKGVCKGFIGLDDIFHTHKFTHHEELILSVFSDTLINLFGKIERDNKIIASNRDLEERHKELNCLYKISKLNESVALTPDKYFNSIVSYIKDALFIPSKTSVEINFNSKVYSTSDFIKTSNCLVTDIYVSEVLVGFLEVCIADDMVFLKEEIELFQAVKTSIEDHLDRGNTDLVLRRSEERLAKIIETETSFVLRTDLFGRPTYQNAVFKKTFAWIFNSMPQDEIIAIYTICEHHQQRAIDTVSNCLANPGKVFQVLLDKPTQSGGIMKTIWEFVCLTNELNEPFEIQCMGQDITDISDANEIIRKKEELYRSLIESGDSAISLFDKEGRYLFVNAKAARLFGMAPNDFENSDIRKVFKQEDAQDLLIHIKWVFENKKGVAFERDFLILNTNLSFRVSLQPVFSQNNEVDSVLVNANNVTDFKLVQNKLLESENLYHVLFDQSPDPYFFIENGVFTQCNQAAIELLKCSKEFIVGKSPHEFSPDFQPNGKLSETYAKQLFEDADVNSFIRFDWVHLRPDGSVFEVDVCLTKINFKERQMLFCTWRDITNTKEAAKSLLISENRLRSLAENSLSVIWELNKDGRFTYVNAVSQIVFGYKPNELIGKKFYYELFPENLRDEYIESMMSAAENGGHVINKECKIQQKNGNIIWVSKNISAIKSSNGELISFIGSDIDISEKKDIEERKRMFKLISDQANYGAAIANLDGVLIYCNEHLAKMHGYKLSELIGKPLSILHNERQISRVNELVELIISEGGFNALEVGHCKKDGTEFPCLMSAKVVSDENQNPLYTSATMIDITEAKNRQAEIIYLNENLEKKIQDRTKELSDSTEMLLAAKTEAENANKAKSEFLSRMSHEFRTPLNSILGFAQLIEMTNILDSSIKKKVDHIKNSGSHLLELVNEILDLSKIEAGVVSLSLEPLNLNRLINETFEQLMPIANQRKIDLTFKNPLDQQFFVYADQQRMKQILINLISNGLKYNHIGGNVCVSIEVNNENSSNEHFTKLKISDTGFGISNQDLERIFNPFERVSKDGMPIEGTGLGLSVVKQLIELMHGEVGVESTLNVGSTFWVKIPTSNSSLNPMESQIPVIVNPVINYHLKGTILYIEDNLSNIELIKHALKINLPKIKLFTQTTGVNAVKVAIKFKPQLVLLDLNLPDMHGSEVLKWLKENSETKDIPVIIISADSTPEQIKKLKNLGAENYITKPLQLNLFLKEISKILIQNSHE
ncbi:MAG: PAS domain S-box protein [Bacteroidia bacterium]|nr:PAS domain S-box protein [Bacteroidia bacterium]MCF8428172.1 PAS domain S-box protein [Bacteroidia bacterium]MCF8445436.1 PAS domain S-box protein [Bacteroidia bacterium]